MSHSPLQQSPPHLPLKKQGKLPRSKPHNPTHTQTPSTFPTQSTSNRRLAPPKKNYKLQSTPHSVPLHVETCSINKLITPTETNYPTFPSIHLYELSKQTQLLYCPLSLLVFPNRRISHLSALKIDICCISHIVGPRCLGFSSYTACGVGLIARSLAR